MQLGVQLNARMSVNAHCCAVGMKEWDIHLNALIGFSSSALCVTKVLTYVCCQLALER